MAASPNEPEQANDKNKGTKFTATQLLILFILLLDLALDMGYSASLSVILLSSLSAIQGYLVRPLLLRHSSGSTFGTCRLHALSDRYLQDDLVAVQSDAQATPRLCAVTTDGGVAPLCIREDDVETDLFCDPRQFGDIYWKEGVTDNHVVESFREGYYGQRPVPSLGGGPGYGAEADEIWSVPEETLELVRKAGVDVPVLDVGIAHGEKARGGSF